MKKRRLCMMLVPCILIIVLLFLVLLTIYNRSAGIDTSRTGNDGMVKSENDLIIDDIFYKHKDLIQNMTEVLLKYEVTDGEVISVDITGERQLPNDSSNSFYYSLGDDGLDGGFSNEKFNRVIQESGAAEILGKIKESGFFSEVIINCENNNAVIVFCINNETIPEICDKNNGSGADIIYYVGKRPAEDYGYRIITGNYYSYIKPRPE